MCLFSSFTNNLPCLDGLQYLHRDHSQGSGIDVSILSCRSCLEEVNHRNVLHRIHEIILSSAPGWCGSPARTNNRYAHDLLPDSSPAIILAPAIIAVEFLTNYESAAVPSSHAWCRTSWPPIWVKLSSPWSKFYSLWSPELAWHGCSSHLTQRY